MLRSLLKSGLLCLAFTAIFGSTANAQMGYFDSLYYKGVGLDYKCTGGLVQPDSNIIVTGRFAYVNERYIYGIARLKPDGSNDYTFNIGTGADEHVNAVVRQPDGKLVIGGDFKVFNGTTFNHIARLNADGSIDTSFHSGTGLNTTGTIYSLYRQPDGKILAGGIFTTYNGTAKNNLIRLNIDGTIDNTFITGTGPNSGVYGIGMQPDSKIVVCGNFVSYNGDTATKRLMRLNNDGTRDMTFDVGAGFTGSSSIVTDLIIMPSGKIMTAGYFTTVNGNSSNRIARINNDGSYDATFVVGTGFNNNVNDLGLQADGKVIATGGFTQYKGAACSRIIRIDSTGTRDASFYVGGGLNLSANGIFMNPDGKIYVGGTFTLVDSFTRIRIVRLLTTGKVDQTFQLESKLNNQVMAIGMQSTGKAIITGAFTKYNQINTNRIARLNADGSLDATFLSGIGANNNIRAVLVLSDDKILIAGDFTSYNGTTINRIARLNPDGTLDNTFTPGVGANSTIYKIATDAGGRIYICGNFQKYNNITKVRLARLSANGVLDNAFNTGAGFNNAVYSMALQPDGKVVVGGSFTTAMGITTGRIARTDSLGNLDIGFNVGGTGSNSTVYALVVQPDGKLLVGGGFSLFNGATRQRIMRLNTDGSLDNTFTAVISNGIVFSILMTNSVIMAGGTFTNVNSVAAINRVVELTPTGTTVPLTSFYRGTGFESTVNALYEDRVERKILVGGNFLDCQKHVAIKLARIKNTNIEITNVPGPLCHGAITNVYYFKHKAFNNGNNFIIQLSDSSGNFTNPTNIGTGFANGSGYDSVDVFIPNTLPYSSSYAIRIVSSDPADTSNIFKPVIIQAPVAPTVTASGPTAMCPGQSVVLTASASNSYHWSNGDSTQSIVVAANGIYSVTASAYGCSAVSIPVNVSTDNVPDSSVTSLAISYCSGGSIRLTATPGNTYSWSTTETTQSIVVNTTGNYTLTITSSANCTADSTVFIDFTNFSSYIVVPNGPTTFCQGGNVTLTSAPGTNYAWSNGSNTQNVTVTQSGNYNVTVTDNTNCTASSSNVNVTVNPTPNATITASGPTTFCQGDSVTLSAAPALDYQWSNAVNTQSQTVSTSGFYTLTVTNTSTNCTASSGVTTVNVNSVPSVTYTLTIDTICNGQGVIQLSAGSPSGGTFSGNGVSGTSFNPQNYGGTNVTITYSYTDGNGCHNIASDDVYVDICTDINDLQAAAIKIYPNPTSDNLFVNMNDASINTIEIFDMVGKVVLHIDAQSMQGTIATINVSQLAAGPYILMADAHKFRFVKN